jgi:hypothetical protein
MQERWRLIEGGAIAVRHLWTEHPPVDGIRHHLPG